MDKTIVCTLYRRPEFSFRMLSALVECYGFKEYDVTVSIDLDESRGEEWKMTCAAAISFAAGYSNITTIIQPVRLGIDEHKIRLLDEAFGRSGYVIHLEDDTIPALDFLRFHEWAQGHYRDDPRMIAVGGWSKPDERVDGIQDNTYMVAEAPGYNCWGWGTWRGFWEAVMADSGREYRKWAGAKVNGLFDAWWRKWNKDYGTLFAFPHVARIQNLVGQPGTPSGGENQYDPGSPTNFNAHGVWEIDDLPDPKPDVWRVV